MTQRLEKYIKTRGILTDKGSKGIQLEWPDLECGPFKDGWFLLDVEEEYFEILNCFGKGCRADLLSDIIANCNCPDDLQIVGGDEPYIVCRIDRRTEEFTGFNFSITMDNAFAHISELVQTIMTRYFLKLISVDLEARKRLKICEFNTNNRTRFLERFPLAGRKLKDNTIIEPKQKKDDDDDIDDFINEMAEKEGPLFKKKTATTFKKKAKTANSGFKAIAGMDQLKATLEEQVLWTLTHKEQAKKYKITPPSGMLLYGPPGCGKTYFAEKFAEESGFNYRLVKPSELGSVYLHGSQGKISEMFDETKKNAPCVLCLDEIDALAPNREKLRDENRSSEVNEFLCQLNDSAKAGVFVIGMTNIKDAIDPAIMRKGRLDIVVEVPAPDKALRASLFEFHLKGRPMEKDLCIDALAEMTEGYASSDIVAIVNAAAIKAARADVLISQELLSNAVKTTESSLKTVKTKRPVGFKAVGA